jgi:AraC-like DNA-binding protein
MGRTLGHLNLLLKPLHRVSERCLTIPPNEFLVVKDPTYFRVLFFLEGGLKADVASGESFTIEKGDVLTVGASMGLTYRGQKPDREVCSHVLKIDMHRSDAVTRSPASPLMENGFWELVGDAVGTVRHYPGQLRKFGSLDLLKQINIELDRGDDASPWRVSGLCLALITPLFESQTEGIEGKSSPRIHRGEAAVEHARQYIQEYAHHELNLGKIAWQVQLSGEHLGRLFQKHLGVTVLEYLKQVRLENVTRYLVSTDLPVVEICKKTGYSTPSLLCRHFKEKTGMTPLTYRMRSRKREEFSPSQLQTGSGLESR